MKTIAKEIPHSDFGHLDTNLKRDSKWNAAIDAKMRLAQKTLRKTAKN